MSPPHEDESPALPPAATTAPPPLLALRGLVKIFPGVRALDGVDFALEVGSVHALVGENGAGKSTLVRILAGATQPDAGTIEIDGRTVVLPDALAARRQGIAVVHQELQLADDLSVAENVFLGSWPRRPRSPCLDFGRLHAEARRVLAMLHLEIPVEQSVRGLGVATRQLVEIARALSFDSRVLVLDEPSAVLTPHELGRLFGIVRGLRARGVAVLYISHRLEEIFALADRVTVLRDGKRVATHAVGAVDRDGLVAEMVGRALRRSEPPTRLGVTGEPVLRIEGLTVGRRFHDVSFTVAAGEIFALAGLVGSGRSSVLQAIFGAVRADSGGVRVGDARGPFAHPREAIAAGVAFLPEDRKAQGLLLERSVRENVSLARLGDFASHGWLDLGGERAAVAGLLAELHVKTPHAEVEARTLSGGNQQKLLLARWMGSAHRVVLLDEPTRGVDVGAKEEIHALVRRLAGEGSAVVVASSELPEVIALADRIGVMSEGRLAGVLDNARRDVEQEAILDLAAKGALPFAGQ